VIRVAEFFRVLGVAALCVVAGGCFPSGRSQLDEEKEPYFLAGKSRESAMDFKGAIESFEKAVEVNPHSASAHLELGLLYVKDNQDCAAAIYHFNRYLALMPNAPNEYGVKQRIFACKQALAQEVSLGPVTQNLQHEFDQLTEDNKRLRDQVEALRAANVGRSTLTEAGAGSSSRSNVVTQISGGTSTTTTSGQSTSTAGAGRSTSSGATARTYKVLSRDTLASIARKSGVKLEALMAANPGVVPQKLRIGQSLNLPAP